MNQITEIGVITIDIEIKTHSRIKDFFLKLHSRLEDAAFSIIQKLPERFIPRSFMEWLDRYTTKRIKQLKQQAIKQTWRAMYLQDAVNDISNRKQP